MRKIGWLLASSAVVLMCVAWVDGQQEEKKKSPFGGIFPGGVFGGQRQDPLNLLRNPQVKKELDISDEQMEKLPAEVMAAIGKVLNEKQMKRFHQIELQQRGNNAFKDETVQKDLKLTSDQKKSINSILEDSGKESSELFKAGGGIGDFKGRFEKMETIRKETREKINGVLSKEQRKTWRELIGEEFKMERFAFPGIDKKGSKKKDE